jgi:hypothetical protein
MARVHHRLEERNHRLRSSRNVGKTRKRHTTAAAIAAVRAELIGTNCAIALGINAHSPSPVVALCRALIEAGHDPATPLHVLRGNTLALRIRSIGEAARLEVSQHGVGFVARRERGAGSSMRANVHARRASEAARQRTPDAAE